MARASGRDGSNRGIDAFHKHRQGRLRHRPDIAIFGDDARTGFLYRPHELLVRHEDAKPAPPLFEKFHVRIRKRQPLPLLGLVRYLLSPETNIPRLVQQFREADGPEVAPNHVLSGEPIYLGGPAGWPTPAEQVDFRGGEDYSAARVAVIDTGYFAGANGYLDAHCHAGPADDDALDVLASDGYLDDETGHGTFIAGIVLQLAPAARVELTKVLDSEGYGSETAIAHAIVAHRDADVINLSLGGFSDDNREPIALTNALAKVSQTTAVIASAGNADVERPMWPAASERVIGVGAVERDGKTKARFSNFGKWVDACAVGVDVHSAYVRFHETGTDPNRHNEDFKGFARWSGTSFAAPQVAGAVAARVTPTHRGRDVATQLVNAGTPVPNLGRFVPGLP
jgi:subtilisin family serine protease